MWRVSSTDQDGPVEVALDLHELSPQLVGMARAALPHEVCGLLVGPASINWESSEALVVSGVERVRNAAGSPTRFVLDPESMLAVERAMNEAGLVVVGVMHSHPTSEATPSATDLADAQMYDPQAFFIQVIVSMQGFAPTIRAWRYASIGD
jgi:proteasome lid subunit RPN8/RPN11